VIDDAQNEQLLWFTRRIVGLEADVREARAQQQRAQSEASHERFLADALATMLRAVARGEKPERFVARADPDEAARAGDSALPLEMWRDARRNLFPRTLTQTVEAPPHVVEWP